MRIENVSRDNARPAEGQGVARGLPEGLKTGDSFTARVVRVGGDSGAAGGGSDMVTLRTPDGQVFQARLEGDVQLRAGETVELTVSDLSEGTVALAVGRQGDTVSIQPGGRQPPQAGTPDDPAMRPYADALRQQGLPVSREALAYMRDMMAQDPTMSLSRAAFLAGNRVSQEPALLEAAQSLMDGGAKVGDMLGQLAAALRGAAPPPEEALPGAVPPPAGPESPAAPPGKAAAPPTPHWAALVEGLLGDTLTAEQTPPAEGQLPPAEGQIPSVEGQIPPAEGQIPPTGGQIPPTEGQISLTEGQILPTEGQIPPAEGQIPPTEGQIPPAEGQIPPAEGQVPPAGGQIPPAEGQVPPTEGQIPPTEGQIPPAEGQVPPTEGQIPPAEGQIPPAEAAPTAAVPPEGQAAHPVARVLAQLPQLEGSDAAKIEQFARVLETAARETAQVLALPESQQAEGLAKLVDSLFARIDRWEQDTPQMVQKAREELFVRLGVLQEALGRADGGAERPEAAQQAQRLMDHLRLLGQIEQFTYVQIPVQQGENRKTAEMYIYQNKKKGRRIDPENVRILLALDLEHMGRVQAFMAIRGRDVSMRLDVERQEWADFFRSQTVTLHTMLGESGYRLLENRVQVNTPGTTVESAMEALGLYEDRPAGLDVKI